MGAQPCVQSMVPYVVVSRRNESRLDWRFLPALRPSAGRAAQEAFGG